MKPGIYNNLSSAEYHAAPGVSKSGLDRLARSPQYYQWTKENPIQQTPAMLDGSALHTLVLEPHLFDDLFAVMPEGIDRRTKAGKERFAEFERESAGKDIISLDIYERTIAMRDAVFANEQAAALISGAVLEQSIFWIDEQTGQLCKCRPDIRKGNLLADLKKTKDASPAGFSRAIHNYRYHVQAGYYCEGASAALGELCRNFLFICVEPEPPHHVAVYLLDQNAREKGRWEAAGQLELLAECERTGRWPGYAEDIQVIDLPAWGYR